MARRFPPLLLVTVLLLGACASREVVLDPNGNPVAITTASSDAPDAPTTPETTPAGSRATETDPVPTKAADVPKRSGDPPRKGGPADHNTMPLTVTLNQTCAEPGDAMMATAETLPRSKLAFAASYSDNDFVPNFTYVPAEGNPTGTFTWTWEITPATPRGDALVTVVAANSEGDETRGASYEAPFRVADAC